MEWVEILEELELDELEQTDARLCDARRFIAWRISILRQLEQRSHSRLDPPAN